MTEEKLNRAEWKENVILVDADYVDKVLFNLTVNFERMLERHIPKASLALWADCVALDGGLRPGDNEIQVVLIHSKQKVAFDYFGPSNFADELTDKAFKDHIGEFIFNSYPVEDEIVDNGDFFTQALQLIATQKEVRRLMVIPNAEDSHIYNKVRETLNQLDDDENRQAGDGTSGKKHVMVYAMQPMPGGRFQQEILGYSLMAALRIKPDEINNKIK